jgi:hypothetical protein
MKRMAWLLCVGLWGQSPSEQGARAMRKGGSRRPSGSIADGEAESGRGAAADESGPGVVLGRDDSTEALRSSAGM